MLSGTVRCVLAPGQRADWTFVVGRGFLAALPVDAPAAVVERLSAQVAEPVVQLESLVALLPLVGEHRIESFVVVTLGGSVDDDGVSVSIVVRGDIAAEVYSVGGSRRFSDRGIRPWHLADFHAVVGIDIVSARASPGASRRDVPTEGVPIGVGTLAGTALRWLLTNAPAPSADPVGAVPSTHSAANREWFGLRLPGGDERRIDSVFLLGRRPRQQTGGTDAVTLVPLASPTSAVSATHLEIRPDGARVLVTDLHSTNGTTLTFPDGRSERMRPGMAVVATPGTAVHVGDGNIVEILPASER